MIGIDAIPISVGRLLLPLPRERVQSAPVRLLHLRVSVCHHIGELPWPVIDLNHRFVLLYFS